MKLLLLLSRSELNNYLPYMLYFLCIIFLDQHIYFLFSRLKCLAEKSKTECTSIRVKCTGVFLNIEFFLQYKLFVKIY